MLLRALEPKGREFILFKSVFITGARTITDLTFIRSREACWQYSVFENFLLHILRAASLQPNTIIWSLKRVLLYPENSRGGNPMQGSWKRWEWAKDVRQGCASAIKMQLQIYYIWTLESIRVYLFIWDWKPRRSSFRWGLIQWSNSMTTIEFSVSISWICFPVFACLLGSLPPFPLPVTSRATAFQICV